MKDNIYEKMDTNSYLVGFLNGVYDLKNNCFRNAEPEELVSTTTGYEFSKPKKEYVEKLNKILINL